MMNDDSTPSGSVGPFCPCADHVYLCIFSLMALILRLDGTFHLLPTKVWIEVIGIPCKI